MTNRYCIPRTLNKSTIDKVRQLDWNIFKHIVNQFHFLNIENFNENTGMKPICKRFILKVVSKIEQIR